ncbi:hypothetical protein [Paraburkholderia phosphatilytica]|uniref:hypothetical protein n=1 Tax=Paraburkholderia phosphatilytica TaxID=2282883 RepID=UPI001F0C637D|nr:hypothetical protein [Paraburkholderia phosphatilytica]
MNPVLKRVLVVARPRKGIAATETRARCAACRHRADERQELEQRVAGLVVFGSGFGASIASSRLCRLHDRLVSPDDTCGEFNPRG